MKITRTLTVVVVLVSPCLFAETPAVKPPDALDPRLKTPEGVADAVDAADDAVKRSFDIGPFKLAVGPTDSGAFGTSLTGDGRKTIGQLTTSNATILAKGAHLSSLAALVYDIDAGWTTQENAANNASISLKPTISMIWSEGHLDLGDDPGAAAKALWDKSKAAYKACDDAIKAGATTISAEECGLLAMPTPIISIDTFADLRYRYGYVEQTGAVVQVNQALLGGGLTMVLFTEATWIREWPNLTVGYYTVQETDTSLATVPPEIEVDFIKAAVSTKLNIGPQRDMGDEGNDYPFRLYVNVDASKPTEGTTKEWEALYKAQFVYMAQGEIKPALTFREGREQGLDYDKELILGILFELLGR